MKTYDTVRAEDIPALLKKAERGNKHAQLVLGQCYYRGNQVKRDPELGKKYFKLAAENGSAVAMRELAWLYRVDENDDEKFDKYIKEAAEKKDPEALLELARQCFWTGDNAARFHYARIAAKQKHPAGMNLLGECYRDGIGTAKDPVQAFKMFKKASDAGDADAMYNLAFCYYNERDFDRSCDYIEKAVEHGNIGAQSELPSVASFRQQKKDLARRAKQEEWRRMHSNTSAPRTSDNVSNVTSSAETKPSAADESLEKERNRFLHCETKISVRYYNPHNGFMGQTEYDADADVTFYYKNYYGQTKTRTTAIRFSNVRYNSVTVNDCEYRCSSYLKEY